MGAVIRIRERRIEQRLARNATRGMVQPAAGHQDAVPVDVTDRRRLVPPLGLREYWYPALPAKKVSKKKPFFWQMLGEELCFFRGADGEVAAISDVCPHRGASMSQGKCFYAGTVACPYHGAVFDKEGDCVAFLTEGPDSKMVGNMHVRVYPTVTLRGWVFVWMGESEPAPIEEDIPPEFFADKTTTMHSTYTYWNCSWIIAIENQNDAHNAGYAHRNSILHLTLDRARRRTPLGPRTKLVDDRALVPLMQNQEYYADADGKVSYQMYYPGVDGYWPKTQWRRRIWKLFGPWNKYVVMSKWRMKRMQKIEAPEEWSIRGSSWHLPSGVRVNRGIWMYTRYAVPVTENISRVVYFHNRRARTRLGRLALSLRYHLFFNYLLHYNFSGQDNRVAAPCRYWTPETLAPTDSHLMMLRRLVTERSRDAKLAQENSPVATVTVGEATAYERMATHDIAVENSLEAAEALDLDIAKVRTGWFGQLDDADEAANRRQEEAHQK